ncbi:MAG TPA: N-acetylglucosamine-6-phosphate deacetylase [Thermoanaerobaculia bacterium]|nr:N-acetylglucosamine-6-phosphate deacetylase [Thermoanaerobaculia bacterium]
MSGGEAFTFRGRAWTAGGIHDDVIVVTEDGRFADVRLASRFDDPEPNVGEGLMVPGFVDVHVHGGAGADFMDATEEAAHRVCAFHLGEGTTALAATTLSGSREAIAEALRTIAAAARRQPAHESLIAAVHLEGPYLNPEKSGAHDRASLRPADPAEVAFWLSAAPSLPWIMTVAPEIAGVLALIERYRSEICFSIGHTTADFGRAVVALEAGATHLTHLFNAMPPLLHREPGPVGAAFVNGGCTVELIADGIHLHPGILHLVSSVMPDRAALVTDAVRACGMPDGSYSLYEHQVELRDGAVRLASGALAGSVLTMRRAVQNMVELAGLPLETVLPMATEIPAQILGLESRKGRIAAGFDADLLVLSPRFEITTIVRAGERVR